jgi:hypothetical protein
MGPAIVEAKDTTYVIPSNWSFKAESILYVLFYKGAFENRLSGYFTKGAQYLQMIANGIIVVRPKYEGQII